MTYSRRSDPSPVTRYIVVVIDNRRSYNYDFDTLSEAFELYDKQKHSQLLQYTNGFRYVIQAK